MHRLQRTLALVIVLALASVAPAANPCRGQKAKKLKTLIECVDGEKSGLDADFLRGKSPDDIARMATQEFLGMLKTAAYVQLANLTVAAGTCAAGSFGCESANDVLLSCGGLIGLEAPYGYLFSNVPFQDDTGIVTCVVGGCNLETSDRDLVGSVVCIRVP